MNESLPLLSPERAKAVSLDACGHRLDSEAGAPVRLYDSVASTLSTAAELAGAGQLPVWGSVLATRQTAGRGQLGRGWISPPGNLYTAIRLPATPPFTESAAAPALGGMLAASLTDLGLPIWVKWPNDLVIVTPRAPVPYRKVGGILLEERNGAILAGVGLNVAAAPSDSEMREQHAIPAGCLPAGILSAHDLACLADILVYMVASLRQLLADGAARNWRTLTEARLLLRGEPVEVADGVEGQEHTQGRLLGLDNSGGLRLLTAFGPKICTSGSLKMTRPRTLRQ